MSVSALTTRYGSMQLRLVAYWYNTRGNPHRDLQTYSYDNCVFVAPHNLYDTLKSQHLLYTFVFARRICGRKKIKRLQENAFLFP